jgi:hypothetical protein
MRYAAEILKTKVKVEQEPFLFLNDSEQATHIFSEVRADAQQFI